MPICPTIPAAASLDASRTTCRPSSRPSSAARRELARARDALLDDAGCSPSPARAGAARPASRSQAAADRVERHPDGVWYVELAPLGEAELGRSPRSRPCSACSDEPDEPSLDAIVEPAARRPALLVSRQLRAPARRRRRCSSTRAAACSAARGRGDQPRSRWTSPARSPGACRRCDARRTTVATRSSRSAQYDAVRLFVDRAVRARPNFAVDDENARGRRADLRAARRHPARHRARRGAGPARCRSSDIADGLDDRFRLLTGGSRTLLPRQQTL